MANESNTIQKEGTVLIAGISNNAYRERLLKVINEETKDNVSLSDCKTTRYPEETLFECLEMWNPSIKDRTDKYSIHYYKDAICIVFPKKTLLNAIGSIEEQFDVRTDKNKCKWIGFSSTQSLSKFIKLLYDSGYSFKGNNDFKAIVENKNINNKSENKIFDEDKETLFLTLIEIFTPDNRTVQKGDLNSKFSHTKSNGFIVDCVDDQKKKECKVKINDGKTVLFEAFINTKKELPYRICTELTFFEKIKSSNSFNTEFHPSWDKKLEIKDLSIDDFRLVCELFRDSFSSNNENTIGIKVTNHEQKQTKVLSQKELEEISADDELNEIVGQMDFPTKYVEGYVPVIEKDERRTNVFKRSSVVANNALYMAKGKCELDDTHESFIKIDGTKYLEVHHLIPMKEQPHFNESLDREENVVCLCPNCHRKIHYGKDKEKMLEKLFELRSEKIKKCGIYISMSSLTSFYK